MLYFVFELLPIVNVVEFRAAPEAAVRVGTATIVAVVVLAEGAFTVVVSTPSVKRGAVPASR
jgi:hypothetical protein